MRRLLLWGSSLCLLVALAFPSVGWAVPGRALAAGPPGTGVQLTVHPGFDGLASLDGWAPLVVDVVNQGTSVTGHLVARQAGISGAAPAEYSLPLALPEGTRKRLALTVPTQRGARSIDVLFVSGGQELAANTITLQVGGPNDMLVGVLSREPLALQALGQVKLAGRTGNVRLARLTQDNLPDNLTMLANFDMLAIARYDTATLSPGQISALNAWVRRGGVLVLVGGPEWRSTAGGLPPDLVPVKAQGTREVDDLPIFAALGARELPAKGRPFALTTTTLNDARALALDNGDPVIAVGRRDRGTVLFFAVDLTLDPFAAWSGSVTLWETLLLQYRGRGYWSSGDRTVGNPALMARAISEQPLVAGLNLKTLAFWLLGYLLLVGPLGYGLLALFKRRGAVWLLVPVLSLGAVGLLYYQGFVAEGRALMSRSVSVTEVTQGMAGGASRSYLAVFAPSQEMVKVQLSRGDLATPLPMPNQSTADRTITRVQMGDAPVVEVAGLNIWGPQGLMVEREVTGMGGGIDADLHIKGTQLVGTLTNSTTRTIRDAVLVTPAGHELLPELPPGASAPMATSLIGYQRPWRPVFQDIFNSLNIKDMREQLFRRHVLEAAVGASRDVLPAPILFLGWLDEAPAPVSILGRPVSGSHLIYTAIEPKVDPTSYDLPFGLIIGRLVASDGQQRGRSPRGFFLQNGSLTFSLQIPDIDRSVLREVNLQLQSGGPAGTATYKLLNWQTGVWDEYTLGGPARPPAWWSPYMAADGSLLVRVDVKDDGQEVLVPTISLRGR